MHAIHDRVIIQPLEWETETAGGIRLVNPGDDRAIKGKVVSVGDGMLMDTGEIMAGAVKVGDIVLINRHSGSEFQNPEGTFMTIREEEILAILCDEG